MTETLSLEFKKENGKKFTMALPYAKKPVEQADVKTLVQHILTEGVFVFADGSKLVNLEKVVLVTKNEEEVEVSM